jgi:hypothetical protein
MSTQPESRLQRKIQDKLKAEFRSKLFVFKVWGSEHMMAGLPDLIGCYRGYFFGLEVKTPQQRNNTSRRQDYVHDLIRRAGGLAVVVCSPEEAIEALKSLN